MHSDAKKDPRVVRAQLILAAVLTVAALAIAFFAHDASRAPSSSLEARFADNSRSGLSIVPASCPSSPHYTGECDGTPPGTCPSGQVGTPPNCTVPPVCPAGQTGTPPNCSTTDGNPGGPGGGGGDGSGSCPVGYTYQLSVHACVFTGCPIGYALRGTQCVATVCPAGYALVGNQCQICSPSRGGGMICGAGGQCTPQYVCGSDGNLYHQAASCGLSLAQACAYGCGGSACLPPPHPVVADFRARPALVRSGDTTVLTWQTTNMRSCTVTGANGDGPWTGLNGTQISGHISGKVIYTLSCTGIDGTGVSQTATVNIIPVFQEQ